MDLENSGDVLVLTSVTRKDSGIYQCRPQDAAAAEVRGEMQLSVHCEEDTRKTSQHSSSTNMKASGPGAAEPPDMFPLVSVLDPAVVVPKDSELMLRGEDLTATCNALSSLKTSTVWYKVHTLGPGAQSLRSWICSATRHLCRS